MPHLKIKEATKQGFQKAYVVDAINLSYPNSDSRRGRVGKGLLHTFTTSGQVGVVVAALEERQREWYQVVGLLVWR